MIPDWISFLRTNVLGIDSEIKELKDRIEALEELVLPGSYLPSQYQRPHEPSGVYKSTEGLLEEHEWKVDHWFHFQYDPTTSYKITNLYDDRFVCKSYNNGREIKSWDMNLHEMESVMVPQADPALDTVGTTW